MAKLSIEKSFSSASLTDDSGIPIENQKAQYFQNDSSATTSQRSHHRRMKSDLGRTDPAHTHLTTAHKEAFPISKSIWPKNEDGSPAKRQVPSRSRSSTNVLSEGLHSIWSHQPFESLVDDHAKIEKDAKILQHQDNFHGQTHDEDGELLAPRARSSTRSNILTRKNERTIDSKYLLPPIQMGKGQTRRESIVPALSDVTEEDERSPQFKSSHKKSHDFERGPAHHFSEKATGSKNIQSSAGRHVLRDQSRSMDPPVYPASRGDPVKEKPRPSHSHPDAFDPQYGWRSAIVDAEAAFAPQFSNGHPTPTPSAQQFLESVDKTGSSDTEQRLQMGGQVMESVGSVSCEFCQASPRYVNLPCGHMVCLDHALEWLERDMRPVFHFICAWCSEVSLLVRRSIVYC